MSLLESIQRQNIQLLSQIQDKNNEIRELKQQLDALEREFQEFRDADDSEALYNQVQELKGQLDECVDRYNQVDNELDLCKQTLEDCQRNEESYRLVTERLFDPDVMELFVGDARNAESLEAAMNSVSDAFEEIRLDVSAEIAQQQPSAPDISGISPIPGSPQQVARIPTLGYDRLIDSPTLVTPNAEQLANPLFSPPPRQGPLFQGNACYLGMCFPDVFDIITGDNFTDARDIVYFFEFDENDRFANRVHCMKKSYFKKLITDESFTLVDYVRHPQFPEGPLYGPTDANGLAENLGDPNWGPMVPALAPSAQGKLFLNAELGGRKLLMYSDPDTNYYVELNDLRTDLPMFKMTKIAGSNMWRVGNDDGSYAESKQHGQIPYTFAYKLEEIPLAVVKDFIQDLVDEYIVNGQPKIPEACIDPIERDTQQLLAMRSPPDDDRLFAEFASE